MPGAQSLGFDATNRITSGASIAYDGGTPTAGYITNDGNNQYLYDGEGRLCATEVDSGLPNAGAMTGYIYDGDGNRVAKGSITSFSCDSTMNGFTLSNAYIVGRTASSWTRLTGPEGLCLIHSFFLQ